MRRRRDRDGRSARPSSARPLPRRRRSWRACSSALQPPPSGGGRSGCAALEPSSRARRVATWASSLFACSVTRPALSGRDADPNGRLSHASPPMSLPCPATRLARLTPSARSSTGSLTGRTNAQSLVSTAARSQSCWGPPLRHSVFIHPPWLVPVAQYGTVETSVESSRNLVGTYRTRRIHRNFLITVQLSAVQSCKFSWSSYNHVSSVRLRVA